MTHLFDVLGKNATQGDQKRISRATNWYIEPPYNFHNNRVIHNTME